VKLFPMIILNNMAAGFSCYLIILFYNGALLSGVIKKFDKMRSEIKEEK